MQYLIMLIIVVGLAAADFITGFAKAYVKNDIKSRKMRVGGVNKLIEILVMGVAIGLNIGFEKLGAYYNDTRLTAIAGMVTALTVFIYIMLMELISLIENFVEINPQAKFFKSMARRLKSLENDSDDSEK